MFSNYNPNSQLWKIEYNGRSSYIYGTNHGSLNHSFPQKGLNALNSCSVLLSELYSLITPISQLYKPSDNSIMDILVVNHAKSLRKTVIPLESMQEHDSYAKKSYFYPYKDFNVHKYPLYYKNVIIDYRNKKWMNIILPYMCRYSVFIAVGYNHIPGLLNLLMRCGCRVTKV